MRHQNPSATVYTAQFKPNEYTDRARDKDLDASQYLVPQGVSRSTIAYHDHEENLKGACTQPVDERHPARQDMLDRVHDRSADRDGVGGVHLPM